MAVSDELRDHVRDLFAGVGPVEVRRMFGGAGVYLDDACFALLVDGAILMRADEALASDYAAAGSEQWVYDGGRRGPVAMPYWRLPEAAADDPDEAAALGPPLAGAGREGRSRQTRRQGPQTSPHRRTIGACSAGVAVPGASFLRLAGGPSPAMIRRPPRSRRPQCPGNSSPETGR